MRGMVLYMMEPNEYALLALKQVRDMNAITLQLDLMMQLDRTGEVAKIKGRYMDAVAPIIEDIRTHVRHVLIDENPHG